MRLPWIIIVASRGFVVYSLVVFSSCGDPNLYQKDAFWLRTWLKIKTKWEKQEFQED